MIPAWIYFIIVLTTLSYHSLQMEQPKCNAFVSSHENDNLANPTPNMSTIPFRWLILHHLLCPPLSSILIVGSANAGTLLAHCQSFPPRAKTKHSPCCQPTPQVDSPSGIDCHCCNLDTLRSRAESELRLSLLPIQLNPPYTCVCSVVQWSTRVC